MRDHAPTAHDLRMMHEAEAPNPYSLAPERVRGEQLIAEAKAAPRVVSTDRADVLQVAGELLGERRDNRVEAMHHAGLMIRALQARIDELTKPHIAQCAQCAGHGQILGYLCNENCDVCGGTGNAPITQMPTTSDTEMVPTRDQKQAEIDRLKAQLKLALEACKVIDDIVIEGDDNFKDMAMHMLQAVEPARAALKGGA